MTREEFKLLSYPEQDEIITDSGVYLLNYVQGDTMHDLYKLRNFYVKFSYNIKDDKEPTITILADDVGFNLYENLQPAVLPTNPFDK